MTELEPRRTARALVLDPQDRVLLFEYEADEDVDPARPGLRRFWFTPGGGLEEGEAWEEALARELHEEIGIAGIPAGPWVGRRERPFLLFRHKRFIHERHYLVRLPSPEIDTSRLQETEKNPVLDVRWWRIESLLATPDWVEPGGFAGLARRIASGHVPGEPVRLA